jgi:hypothetical protein
MTQLAEKFYTTAEYLALEEKAHRELPLQNQLCYNIPYENLSFVSK